MIERPVPRPPSGSRRADRLALGLASLLAVAGIGHLVAPRVFDPIVPRSLPGHPRLYTLASGAAELMTAGLLASPSTRRAGGAAAAALFVAVFPANIRMTADDLTRRRPVARRVVSVARLPLQAPLVLGALAVARHAASPSRGRAVR